MDLELKRGKTAILKAEDKDYDRGMLIKLLEDGGYKAAYWYEDPFLFLYYQILIMQFKFHPKSYYKDK